MTKVAFTDIIKVNFRPQPRPARITLTLAAPCKLGSQIVFASPAQIYFNAFPSNEIADDLLSRAIAARAKRPT